MNRRPSTFATVLRGPYSLRATRRVARIALFLQAFIVFTGATVRLTGSGLGCPNWPTCTTTKKLPAFDLHPQIEFLNRMTTTPTLIAALIALWMCFRLAGGPRRDLRIASSLVVFGIFVQAGLGALTVLRELPPQIVSAHFLVSIFLITAATFTWHAAHFPTRVRLQRGPSGRTKQMVGIVMLLALLAVVIAGVLTTASGPHSGGTSSGLLIDRFPIFRLAVTFHARGAYAFFVLVLALTFWRARRGPALRDLTLLGLMVAIQITLGEIQFRNGLPAGVVLAHVVNAAVLWLVASRIAIDAAFEPTVQKVRSGSADGAADEPKATAELAR